MKDKDIRFEVKNPKLRTAAFVIAFVIAVGAFAVGIASLGKRQDGYYVITPDPSGDALFFASGIELTCYFEGTAREIRAGQTEVRKIYSRDLLRFYKLLDPEVTYEGFANLASVNRSPGEWVAVPEELYGVLKDAAALSESDPQFSLTAGALYAEWNGILSLSEPQDADPLFSAEEAQRLESITSAVNAENAVTLGFDDANSAVRLTLSDEYKKTAQSLELSPNVLDLGVLHDAYYVQLTADALQAQGVTRGILQTESGLCVSLSDSQTGDYSFRSFVDGAEAVVDTMPLPGGSAVCQCRTYTLPTDRVMYYTLEKDGKAYRRSPWVSAASGGCADALLCAYASAKTSALPLPRLVCECFRLLAEGASRTDLLPGVRYDFIDAGAPETLEKLNA